MVLLTVDELSKKIRLEPQTIRNLVSDNLFKKNVHYLQPGRKLLFVESQIELWLLSKPVKKIRFLAETGKLSTM